MHWGSSSVYRVLSVAVVAWAGLLSGACTDPPPPMTHNPSLDTDIYVARGEWTDEGPRFFDLVNVTKRSGYDNQPNFLPDGSGFIYTVINDDGLSDIWMYRLGAAVPERLTMTLTTEFMPKVMPADGGFSSIRYEEGFSRLWAFSEDGRPQRVILRDHLPFGYYAWVNASQVAMVASYSLGEDEYGELQIVDVATETVRTIASDVGRCVAPLGEDALVYVDKSAEPWMVRGIDIFSGEERFSFPGRKGMEDFAVVHDGSVLMGEGGRLFRRGPGMADWELVADFTDELKGPISRVAASRDGSYIAIVAEAG